MIKMIRVQYFQQLDLLKRSILSLGEMSELIFKDSMEAVMDLNVVLANKTLALEPGVDKLEEGIESSIFDLLALQQPMASDLRLVVSAIKIEADLKRILELSINIARIPGKIEGGHIKPLIDTKKNGRYYSIYA